MEVQLYKALLSAGVSDVTAADVVDSFEKEIKERIREARSDLVTTSILKAEIAELKVELIKWNVGAIFAAAGLAMAFARFSH